MMCAGRLRKPEPHDNDFNTHRLCINTTETGHGIVDLQINKGDMFWFQLLFKGLTEDAVESYPPMGHYKRS